MQTGSDLGYPKSPRRITHARLKPLTRTSPCEEFTSFVNGGAEELSNDVGTNLRSWLTFHIDKYDNAYLAFMEPPKAEEKNVA
jgi:hypothetical protein